MFQDFSLSLSLVFGGYCSIRPEMQHQPGLRSTSVYGPVRADALAASTAPRRLQTMSWRAKRPGERTTSVMMVGSAANWPSEVDRLGG